METLINGKTFYNKSCTIKCLSIDILKNIDEVYICPSFSCNINCPHCHLRKIDMKMDLEKVLETIAYINKFNNTVIYDFFGGEPLLLKDEELDKIYNSIQGHTYHISTNLLAYKHNSLIQNKIIENAEYIDTSWNPLRFTEKQYKLWLKNVRILQERNVKIEFMITLTDDLIENYSAFAFYEKIKEWKPYGLTLDYLLGGQSNIKKINEWLVELYKIWDCPTIYGLAERCKKLLKMVLYIEIVQIIIHYYQMEMLNNIVLTMKK